MARPQTPPQSVRITGEQDRFPLQPVRLHRYTDAKPGHFIHCCFSDHCLLLPLQDLHYLHMQRDERNLQAPLVVGQLQEEREEAHMEAEY